jgi:hypothetical protein
MMGFFVTGCRSGKSSRHTLRSTQVLPELLTVEAQQFLSVIAPRAFPVASLLAVQLKVTVRVLFSRAISEGLIVKTTFSILTPTKHFKGQTLLRISSASHLFAYTITETTQHNPKISEHLISILSELSSKVEHDMNTSTFHVLTLQKIIHVETLQMPVLSFVQ